MSTRPHKLKRTLLPRLLLLLLAYTVGGAIINVAVAWCFAVRAKPSTFNNEFLRSHPDDPTWYFITSRATCAELVLASAFPFADVGWQYQPDRTPTWSMVAERPSSSFNFERPFELDKIKFFWEGGYGWPLLNMRALVQLGPDMKSIESTSGALILEGTGPVFVDGRLLPLRPIWPGFAINTIFYAAILWLLFAAPGWARRRIRARRGQCPACAYPVGTSNVCTECGRPVRAIL